MNTLISRKKSQVGSVLLEALIAMLIFSMGILAIVGLQAASIKTASDAKYRSDAAMLANQLIGQMWVSNRTAIPAQFSSPAGAAYVLWAADVQAALPGATANMPSVTIATSAAVAPATPIHTVSIILRWQAPGETTVHSYSTSADINE